MLNSGIYKIIPIYEMELLGEGHGIELIIRLGVKQAWVGILASPLHLYIHFFLHSTNKYVLDIVR